LPLFDDSQKSSVGHVGGGNPQVFQIAFQKGDGLDFPAAQFGLLVEMAAQAHGFRCLGAGQSEYIHRTGSFLSQI
jgi:hypothetical protein